jgi:hypothetical protein
MSGRLLSPDDRAHLRRMMRCPTPSPVHRRMNTLLLLEDSWTAECVDKVLFIDVETAREHHRLYRMSGFAGVERLKYEGAESALSPEQFEALGAELVAHLYMTAKSVCAFVERSLAVTYAPHAMAMKVRSIRQAGLFDAVIPPADPSMTHGTGTLAMLCILLIEAVAAGSKEMAAQPTDVGDDHHHR